MKSMLMMTVLSPPKVQKEKEEGVLEVKEARARDSVLGNKARKHQGRAQERMS